MGLFLLSCQYWKKVLIFWTGVSFDHGLKVHWHQRKMLTLAMTLNPFRSCWLASLPFEFQSTLWHFSEKRKCHLERTGVARLRGIILFSSQVNVSLIYTTVKSDSSARNKSADTKRGVVSTYERLCVWAWVHVSIHPQHDELGLVADMKSWTPTDPRIIASMK